MFVLRGDFFPLPLVWQSACAHYLLLWYPTGGLNRVVGNRLFLPFALTTLAPGAVPTAVSFQLHCMRVKRRVKKETEAGQFQRSAGSCNHRCKIMRGKYVAAGLNDEINSCTDYRLMLPN